MLFYEGLAPQGVNPFLLLVLPLCVTRLSKSKFDRFPVLHTLSSSDVPISKPLQ